MQFHIVQGNAAEWTMGMEIGWKAWENRMGKYKSKMAVESMGSLAFPWRIYKAQNSCDYI